MLYEYDGSVEIARPQCVVFPRTAADVVRIVELANRYKIAHRRPRRRARAFPAERSRAKGGIIVSFARMNRILEIDAENQRAVVQPGVVNSDLSCAVEHRRSAFRAGSVEPEVPAPSAETYPKMPAARTRSPMA